MFPRFFNEDSKVQSYSATYNSSSIKPSGLIDRSKYSRKSLVIADFTPVEANYSVNRLYTSMLLSLGVMSFILITYGLHSGLSEFIYPG
ncbi:Predicted protein [Prochlorococcus marinus subsp. marinus str. CCMP1375]|uniref:Uncharacterized protein n=1 Tax=Prochlorococcus marinus (strain SARG / CCMP1375 / SS120) TaxID=167539 RepID=Q7VBD0_PROMA|nr:Predicted protein [Prochlorococcus marinus subsp. marinus str. CCMP1375]